MDFDEQLKWQLTKHEGEKLQMYTDSKGILTIGIGHNIEERGISPAVSALMFEEDIAESVEEARANFGWYLDLNEPRQAVIINMLFNLGLGRFRGFKKTIQFLENQLYHSAAEEMLLSLWAEQVGRRAVELSRQMRFGEWQA